MLASNPRQLAGQRSAPPTLGTKRRTRVDQPTRVIQACLAYQAERGEASRRGARTMLPPDAAAATQGFDGARTRLNRRSKIQPQANRGGANYREERGLP